MPYPLHRLVRGKLHCRIWKYPDAVCPVALEQPPRALVPQNAPQRPANAARAPATVNLARCVRVSYSPCPIARPYLKDYLYALQRRNCSPRHRPRHPTSHKVHQKRPAQHYQVRRRARRVLCVRLGGGACLRSLGIAQNLTGGNTASVLFICASFKIARHCARIYLPDFFIPPPPTTTTHREPWTRPYCTPYREGPFARRVPAAPSASAAPPFAS